MPTVAFHNLGCKVNSYETDCMMQELEEAGYTLVPFDETADIYVINTCSVTNIADRKSRQMLRRGKKKNPDAIVVGLGCYVQMWQEKMKEDGLVDIVIGNNKKMTLLSALEEYIKTRENQKNLPLTVMEEDEVWRYEDSRLSRVSDHTRAYVKIQDGCNQFCSYCIIPYARGRIRSRELESIREEVTALAGNGYREIVLTGIHLGSYGKDKKDSEITLLDAIRLVHGIEGIERIRLGSLEPGTMTESFVSELSKLPKVCPHFHLSMQSGSETVLKRMNRHYTPEEYYLTCERLRRYFDRPAITTDVIAGFPGETDEEAKETEAFVKKVQFAEMHVFKYSMRKGTVAAKRTDQIDEAVKTERSAGLIAAGEAMTEAYRAQFFGETLEVLFEESVTVNGEVYQVGHTKNYLKAAVFETKSLAGQVLPVVIKGKLSAEYLEGQLVNA